MRITRRSCLSRDKSAVALVSFELLLLQDINNLMRGGIFMDISFTIIYLRNLIRSSYIQQAFFMEDILTCHSRKSSGVNNGVNDG